MPQHDVHVPENNKHGPYLTESSQGLESASILSLDVRQNIVNGKP